jgi:hypothetical protein
MRARAEALAGIEVEDPLTARIARLGLLPLRLVGDLLRLLAPPDATVLDFFAGSGTTGHALLALNAEEGARRRAILVTNDEQNMCRAVAWARMRQQLEGAPLRFFTCGNEGGGWLDCGGSPGPLTDQSRAGAFDTVRVREGCFTPLVAEDGFVVYGGAGKLLGVLYDERSDEELLAAVRNIHSGEQEVAVYTFGGVRGLADHVRVQPFGAQARVHNAQAELLGSHRRSLEVVESAVG